MTDTEGQNTPESEKNQEIIEMNIPAEPANDNKKEMKEPSAPNGMQRIEIMIEVSKEEDFKSFYAIGAIGVNNIYDFRISFYNDEPDLGRSDGGVRKIQRRIGTEVILSPVAAFELARWLEQNVKEHEQKFGPIFKNMPAANMEEPDDSEDKKQNRQLEGYA